MSRRSHVKVRPGRVPPSVRDHHHPSDDTRRLRTAGTCPCTRPIDRYRARSTPKSETQCREPYQRTSALTGTAPLGEDL